MARAHEAGSPPHVALVARQPVLRGEGLQREKRGGSGSAFLEIADAGFGVGEALHHHPLEAVPEHRLDRALEPRRHLEQIGDGSEDTAEAGGTRLPENTADPSPHPPPPPPEPPHPPPPP